MYILNIALFHIQRSRYAVKIMNFILYDRSLTQENRKSLTKRHCRCYQSQIGRPRNEIPHSSGETINCDMTSVFITYFFAD